MKSSTATPPGHAMSGMEAGIAGALALWRLATQAPSLWWRDWVLFLSVFWLFTVIRSRSDSWPITMVSAMAYLLGVYALGQYPHLLTAFGIGK